MKFVFLLLAIAPIVCGFLSFLLGPSGDSKLRDHLVNFYVAVHGDWTIAYRAPAGLVSRFLRNFFGTRPYLVPVFVGMYSILTTTLLAMAHLNLTIPNGVDSSGPILTSAGSLDWGSYFNAYLAPNLVGDMLCWPVSLWLYSKLARTNNSGAILLACLILIVSTLSFVVTARFEDCWGDCVI